MNEADFVRRVYFTLIHPGTFLSIKSGGPRKPQKNRKNVQTKMAQNETQKPVVNQMRDLSSAFDAIPDATMSEFIQSLTQWNDQEVFIKH